MKHGILFPKKYNENSTVYFILAGRDYYFEAQSFFDVLGLLKGAQTVTDVCSEYGIELEDIEAYDERHNREKRAIPSLDENIFEHLLLLIYGSKYPESKKFVDWYFDTLLPLMDYAQSILHNCDRNFSKKWIQDGGIRYYTPIGWECSFTRFDKYLEEGGHES